MAKKRCNKIILGIGLGMFVALIVAGYIPKAHPFSGFKGKTLWDWLSLAGVPVSLAVLGFWLQLQQQQRNEEQAKLERDIADENRQEEILQNYYDKVSALLVEKNLLAISTKAAKAEKDLDFQEISTAPTTVDTATPEERQLLDVSVDVIRARTLTTLRRLNGSRKTSLIRFLLEAEVINRLKLSLAGADLDGADLWGADLSGADLSFGTLFGAKLLNADLRGIQLNNANLKDANLSGANLSNAAFYNANLSNADLSNADLSNAVGYQANLSNANLSGAKINSANFFRADLSRANLQGAVLSDANLTGAFLNNACLLDANLNGADLRNTNLSGTHIGWIDLSSTKGLTKEQLEGEDPPYLCGTQLPIGIDIDPDRDCERWDRELPEPD